MPEATIPELQVAQKAILADQPWSQPAPGGTAYLPLIAVAAADVPVRAIFLDAADSIVKWKDAAGVLHALY